MSWGGKRPRSGRTSGWSHGKTKTIRVPERLADHIMSIAREVDANPQAIDIAVDELISSLDLKSNAGGAIKAKVRSALELLYPLTLPPEKGVKGV